MKTTILNVLESYVKKYSQEEKAIENGSLLESPVMIGYFEAKDILNLKKTLNEIKDFIQRKREAWEKETGNKKDWLYIKDKDILQIIDKVLGEDNEVTK